MSNTWYALAGDGAGDVLYTSVSSPRYDRSLGLGACARKTPQPPRPPWLRGAARPRPPRTPPRSSRTHPCRRARELHRVTVVLAATSAWTCSSSIAPTTATTIIIGFGFKATKVATVAPQTTIGGRECDEQCIACDRMSVKCSGCEVGLLRPRPPPRSPSGSRRSMSRCQIGPRTISSASPRSMNEVS
jgi:hypothetical protein